MKSRLSAGVIGISRRGWFGRLNARIARAAGRRYGINARPDQWVENLESRVMLDGVDHPSFPVPFNPAIGTVVTLQNVPGSKLDGRGAVEGNLASSSGDDTFRFTMPGAMGTTDFVSVLVDTIMRADNTTPWNSTLDSYVEVYNSSGQLLVSGANNSVLSSTNPNVATDGWAGFIGTAGQQYTIRVRSEQGALGAGRTRVGNYTLRVDAATQAIAIDTTFNAGPDKGADTFGDGIAADLIDFRQDEIVYKVVIPNDTRFNSLATASAISEDTAILDTHLSVYDAQGQQVAEDRQTGRLTNAFSLFSGQANTTFFFRVRSDELNAGRPSFGQFSLVLDMSALPLTLDPVTRVNTTRQDPLLGPTMNTGGTASKIYQFRAEGTGLAVITVKGQASPATMTPALADPAVHIYNSNGVQIDFNDDFSGTLNAQLEVVLTGGVTYFILVEGFDRGTDGAFALNIEAHHTFGPTVPVDDHVNSTPQNLLNYENATPIIFGDPFRYTNSDGNIADHSWVQSGVARGRINFNGDTDLFQFTPPVSMLGTFAGNEGDEGAAVYLGGNFANAIYSGSGSGQHTLEANNVAIYDAGRYYNAGPSPEDQEGALVGTIFSMTNWDFDGTGGNAPVLVAGGNFGFLDDMGAVVPANLAVRAFVPFNPLDPASPRWQWFPVLGGPVNGPVFALGTFDIDVPNTNPIQANELIVGGQFTDAGGTAVSNIFALQFTGGGFAVNNLGGGVTGANSQVRAITTYDPADVPDPDMGGPLPDPADEPAGLYVGGRFSAAGGVAGVNNIARFGRIDTMPMTALDWEGLAQISGSYGTAPLGLAATDDMTAVDTILSLTSYDPPEFNGLDLPAQLIIGGQTNATDGFLTLWDPSFDTMGGPPVPNFFELLGPADVAPVKTLTTWNKPDGGGGSAPLLVVGGGSDGFGFAFDTDIVNVFDLLGFADNPIETALAFADVEPAFVSGGEVLYVGGSFTQIQDPNAPGPIAAGGVAKWDVDRDNTWSNLGGVGGGVADLSNSGTAPTTVFALGVLDDDIDGVWDRMERPSDRVSISILPTTDAFLQTTIRVFDSNLNLIYTNQSLTPAPGDDANSGAVDPAAPDPGFINISPPLNLAADTRGFQVWGGEVYYIEVAGAGTGRYTVQVITDAVPTEDMDNGDGAYQDEISGVFEVPDGTLPDISGVPVLLDSVRAGQAPEITIAADGKAHTFLDPTNVNNPAAYNVRAYDTTSAGIVRTTFNDLPTIERVGDTDLYKFRAPSTGYAEIRLATFGIQSGWQEQVTDTVMGQTMSNLLQKNINSPLDGALRIFNNDFEQVGYNNDQYTNGGFLNQYLVDANDDGPVGPNMVSFDPTTRVFRHRDPRVVIPVQAGQTYFIQVESGQLLTALNTDPHASGVDTNQLVDWRHATGAYDVLISTTPSLNGIDDHANNQADATPMLIIDSTGDGSATGVIDDVITGVFQNPNDIDVFRYISPNRGQTTLRVVPTGTNNQLRSNVQIFNTATAALVAQTAVGPGQTAQLNIFPEQGDEFLIVIDGDAGSEGAYRFEVNGPGIVDDHASERDWANATPLSLVPFFGTATANGVIENPDDWDTFTFTAETYETASVKVDSTSLTLDPFVQVYEISSDIDDSSMGNPVLLQISFNNDGPNLGVDSLATFSTTPGRTYFIVVSGVDPNVDFGNYTVQVQVAPTDDHPNFTDFPLATAISLSFDPLTLMGMNVPATAGTIEKDSDNDMFRFNAPATGRATITIATPTSDFAPAVRIFDQTGTELVALTDGANGTVSVLIPNITLNQQYYIQVLPGTTGINEMSLTGDYTVKVVTEPIDDHPDEGEFGLIQNPRDVIVLSSSNGVGTNSGVIVPDGGLEDKDLFRFTTLAGGSTLVRITTTNSSFNPFFKVFNASFVQIGGTASSNGDTATQTFTSGGAGEVYYVLVEKNTGAMGAAAVGNYQISVTGTLPGGGGGGGQGPDDHANAGEFNDATLIPINSGTGLGSSTGVINYVGDTDLFRFPAAASGAASVQIVVPAGGLVDGQVKIFNQALTQIATNAGGIPGATAAITFDAIGGQSYYILVEPVGSAIGSYEVRVDSRPLEYALFYPEGFAGKKINEFVSIINPNPFPVNYSLYARYERNANPNVPIATGIAPANSRSGVTVTRRNFEGTIVRKNEPFAVELRSDGLLGATFSHYDADISTGENLTRETSTLWTFANFTKDPAEFRDFIVFYNPNATQANITITLFYENGFTTSFSQTLDGLRRGGVSINKDGRVPQNGRFGVKIESTLPIVAAQSSYNTLRKGGDGLLGDIEGGAVSAVIPGVSTGSGVTSRLAILNAGTQPATVTLTASYARVDLPDLVRVLTIEPGRVLSQTLQQIGLTDSEVAGLKIVSNVPVTSSVMQYRDGDGDSTYSLDRVGTRYLFGDAFINPAKAGITQKENLSLYNPAKVAIDIVVRFVFRDGTSSSTTINVGAGKFAFVSIDQQPAILGLPSAQGFSLDVFSTSPFAAVFDHYDLNLAGGWSTVGVPVGLLNALSTI